MSSKSNQDHLGLIDQRPCWLEFVDPVSFQPAPQECHLNVLLKMIHEKGDIQHGWILAEDADQGFVEGQFHSVWKSPSGDLMDVTPRKDMEHRVLFVPDPIRFVTFEEHPLGAKISTFDNCRFLRGRLLSQPSQKKGVITSDLIWKYGLFSNR